MEASTESVTRNGIEALRDPEGRLLPSDKIYLKITKDKGRGVFARRPIKKGETIEVCPVIVCPGNQWELLDETAVGEYYLLFGEEDCCLFLLLFTSSAFISSFCC